MIWLSMLTAHAFTIGSSCGQKQPNHSPRSPFQPLLLCLLCYFFSPSFLLLSSSRSTSFTSFPFHMLVNQVCCSCSADKGKQVRAGHGAVAGSSHVGTISSCFLTGETGGTADALTHMRVMRSLTSLSCLRPLKPKDA